MEPFKRPRAVLGDQAPIIEAIDDQALVEAGIWPFYMLRIPGKPWAEYEAVWNDAQPIKAAKSRADSSLVVSEDTSSVVDTVIIPSLQKIRAVDRDDREEFVPYVRELISEAPSLKKLPSFLSHSDLNNINLLLGDDLEVAGLVDWELSPGAQPFGIACYCIQFIAEEIVDKVFRERPAFEAMDRGFWEAVLGNVSEKTRGLLTENAEAVQTAMLIGTLFRVMSVEGDQILVNERLLKSLPKLMSYRIPMIRGSSRAYST